MCNAEKTRAVRAAILLAVCWRASCASFLQLAMLTLLVQRSSAMTRAAQPASAEPAEPNRCSGDIGGALVAATVQLNEKNNCARCLEARQARYRVHTDIIDMAASPACAEEARSLGISVEQLDQV
jgi:hypothetical protein